MLGRYGLISMSVLWGQWFSVDIAGNVRMHNMNTAGFYYS